MKDFTITLSFKLPCADLDDAMKIAQNAAEHLIDTFNDEGNLHHIGFKAKLAGPWIAGTNMPGYLPDSEPCSFDSFDEARDFIIDEVERDIDDLPEDEGDPQIKEDEEDLISVREQFKLLSPPGVYSAGANGRVYWITQGEPQ